MDFSELTNQGVKSGWLILLLNASNSVQKSENSKGLQNESSQFILGFQFPLSNFYNSIHLAGEKPNPQDCDKSGPEA